MRLVNAAPLHTGNPGRTLPNLSNTPLTAKWNLRRGGRGCRAWNIGLYAGGTQADLCGRLVDLGLVAAGDKHIGALFSESLGGRGPMPLLPPITTAILFFS
jgi:hypothetical protein